MINRLLVINYERMNLTSQISLNEELANVNTSTQTKQGIKINTCLQIAYIPNVYF
jgi:hypothetical protein